MKKTLADKAMFPFAEADKENPLGGYQLTPGINLREHFAGLALQGLLANPEREASFGGFARDAVQFADALINELEER